MNFSYDKLSLRIARIFLICSSLFALYTSGFGLFSALTQRSIHWIFMSVPIFLLIPLRGKEKGKISIIDFLFAALSLASSIYLLMTWEKNAMRILEPTMMATIMGIVMIVVVLEATRRTIGKAMTILAIIFLFYAYFGPYFPGILQNKGFTIVNLISFLYGTTEGIMGLPLGTSATYIIIFVLFGSFLAKSGAGQLFVDLSLAVTGRVRSGPALSTILCNALMGIISGSPVANVVTTGAFTLPLLEKTGYPMVTGAALLAVAATGSMFTPPVMGAGAFMIADYLSVGYSKVVLAAVIPAVLFYISLIVYANVTAARSKLKGLRREELPDWKKALITRGHLLIPILALIYFIVIGWSALKTAFWCIPLMIILSWVKRETRMGWKKIIDALVSGCRDILPIVAACAAAGIIVGVISMTGLGIKFSSALMALSQNSPVLALILTMVAALILGMGLPPTAVYIILAALTVPSLIGIGINPMAAHFFVFYFACVGAITPPVALAAYSAAGLAKTNPFTTGWRAFRMGLVAYVIPFLFVINPGLLMQGSSAASILLAFTSCTVGIVFLTFAIEGYARKQLSIIIRLIYLPGSLLLMIPTLIAGISGLVIIVIGLLSSKFLNKGNDEPLTISN